MSYPEYWLINLWIKGRTYLIGFNCVNYDQANNLTLLGNKTKTRLKDQKMRQPRFKCSIDLKGLNRLKQDLVFLTNRRTKRDALVSTNISGERHEVSSMRSEGGDHKAPVLTTSSVTLPWSAWASLEVWVGWSCSGTRHIRSCHPCCCPQHWTSPRCLCQKLEPANFSLWNEIPIWWGTSDLSCTSWPCTAQGRAQSRTTFWTSSEEERLY